MPSCMRAPPEADTIIAGQFFSSPRSIARVIFSPAAEPSEAAMKRKSMTARLTSMPSIFPVPLITESVSFVFAWLTFSFSW